MKALPSKQGSVCKRSCPPVLVVDDVVDLHKVVNVADVARVLGKVVRVRPPVHGVEHEEREEEDVDHEGAALGALVGDVPLGEFEVFVQALRVLLPLLLLRLGVRDHLDQLVGLLVPVGLLHAPALLGIRELLLPDLLDDQVASVQ